VFEGWNFETDDDAFTKEVFTVRNHQVTLGLNIQHPTFTEGEIMLIADMEATKELVGITADTGSDTDIAVMVTSTYHTGLIGSTYAPSTVVFPEGIRADMPTGGTFVPFEIAIDEVFPRIVVLGLMLP
jgi:hypothetical protein